MSEFPLRLDSYFFTHQEVIANIDHEQDSKKMPIHLDFIVNGTANRMAGHESKYAITAHVEINKETSHNLSYFFAITAFGIVSIKDGMQGHPGIESIIETSGVHLLFGAIRERLADLTARGPWQSIQLDFIPLTVKLDA